MQPSSLPLKRLLYRHIKQIKQLQKTQKELRIYSRKKHSESTETSCPKCTRGINCRGSPGTSFNWSEIGLWEREHRLRRNATAGEDKNMTNYAVQIWKAPCS